MRIALSLAILFACMCGPADAQRIRPQNPQVGIPPPGSYQQSCTDVSFQLGGLFATCRTRAGDMYRHWLPLVVSYCAPNSDISNLDGALHCVAIPGTYGSGYAKPGGAYWQTCDARGTLVSIFEVTFALRYVCRDRNNQYVSDFLDMRDCDMRYGIVNQNGHLVCGSDARRLRPDAVIRR